MKTITQKPRVAAAVQQCLAAYHAQGLAACVEETMTTLLSQKIKFPLLEYAAVEFWKGLPEQDHLPFCDQVEALQTVGGNVILGMVLQKRMEKHFVGRDAVLRTPGDGWQTSFQKASAYITSGKVWYVSDIIGERVFGYALRNWSEAALPALKELLQNEGTMVQRGIGAGMHYAVKKGLAAIHVRNVFALLLSKANIRDAEAKQGIGWAAKTVAKFHPAIIAENEATIQDPAKVGQWFRTKIKIGLARNAFANRA